jgi:phage baseplate assembly protein W
MVTNTLTKIYSDIDFTFTRKPVTNDIALSYDEMAVIRSVRNLLLTNHYERPFNPDLGSNINALLFEPISPVTSSSLETEIQSVIENYEPRAQLKSVVVTPNPDQNAYSVTLEFYIQNATLPTVVTLLLERNR